MLNMCVPCKQKPLIFKLITIILKKKKNVNLHFSYRLKKLIFSILPVSSANVVCTLGALKIHNKREKKCIYIYTHSRGR